MLLGCIADDFTGAGDIANTLARGGMRSRLFVGIPASDADADGEAGVIALKSRSVPVAEAVEESLQALVWLRARGCRQFMFKYCSTFDSTPEGNIGPVAEALADALGAAGVVVCPAFPANGRSVYQGHLFVNDHLLSESGMQNHPLTPMTDPDLRRWLQLQSKARVGHVGHAVVNAGAEAVKSALQDAGARNEALVVVDAISEADLLTIGTAIAGAALFTGGSGVALGIPENFRRAGLIGTNAEEPSPVSGRALILSGSCSHATQGQVSRYAEDHPAHCIDVAALLEGEPVEDNAFAFIESHSDAIPLIYSTADGDKVTALQEKYGRDCVAELTEKLFGNLARRSLAVGVKRLVAAGGETSGAVIQALDLTSLRIGPEIAPGVPVLYADVAGEPLAITLKSGNFGDVNFFTTAPQVMAGEK